MKKLKAKKLYERSVLQQYQLNEEDKQTVQGTHWGHKINNTVPDESESFKTVFDLDDDYEPKSYSEMAELLADKIETAFGLHFSSSQGASQEAMHTYKQVARDFLERLVPRNVEEKKKLYRMVEQSDSVWFLLAQLNGIDPQ